MLKASQELISEQVDSITKFVPPIQLPEKKKEKKTVFFLFANDHLYKFVNNHQVSSQRLVFSWLKKFDMFVKIQVVNLGQIQVFNWVYNDLILVLVSLIQSELCLRYN